MDAVNENEGRKHPGVERAYRNERIVVYWEPKLCIHSANCIRGLPQVFNPAARPWVSIDAATADQIAETIMTCPSGALHLRPRRRASGRAAGDNNHRCQAQRPALHPWPRPH